MLFFIRASSLVLHATSLLSRMVGRRSTPSKTLKLVTSQHVAPVACHTVACYMLPPIKSVEYRLQRLYQLLTAARELSKFPLRGAKPYLSFSLYISLWLLGIHMHASHYLKQEFSSCFAMSIE